MTKLHLSVIVMGLITAIGGGFEPCLADDKKAVYKMSPADWPEGELEKYIGIEMTNFPGNPEAVGKHGAVTGSYHGLAQRAGLEALKQGGSSVDAALTTALAQVAIDAGAVISYFGILQMVHYDAATGEIVNMNASWNTVQNETDAMSIPGSIGTENFQALFGTGEPSGRTALVGGFMRGVEAAHQRYGKLPFAALFEPSIYVAEKGLPLNPKIAESLWGVPGKYEGRERDLRRLPESIAVFLNEDGELIREGELFRQPALAKTLRAIAKDGADYMYKGPWAEKAIAAIQADGGKMTLQDLADYEVMWVEPVTAEHGGYTIHANGLPSYGGVMMIEALHLADAAGIPEQGHWSESAESFREVSDLTQNSMIGYLPPETLELMFPGVDLSPKSRLNPKTAEAVWKTLPAMVDSMYLPDDKPKHSDTVVATDKDGNMTAITHSINAVVWGKTAIIVDGISIGDPAVNQKAVVAATTPGERLPEPIEIGILVKDGEPQLAFASMAMGLHVETLQSLVNVIDFGMSPKAALDMPSILYPRPAAMLCPDNSESCPDEEKTPKFVVRVMEGAFDQELLEATGLPIEFVKAEERRYSQGLWVGIMKDPETGDWVAGSHYHTNGQALGY